MLALSPSTVLLAKPLLKGTTTLPVQSHHHSTTNLVRVIINRIKDLFHPKVISLTVNSPLRATSSSQGITLNPTPVMRSLTIRLISRIPNTRVLTEPLILIHLLAGT